jgi:hypothetical protein
VPAAQKQIELRPDWTSYHVLLVVRRDYPAAYAQVTNDKKASTLCSALAILPELNDWGYLDQGGSYEDFAAQALLDVGPAALPYLRPLLDDRNPAGLSGSKKATISSIYQYRRKDFACNYVCKILRWPTKFDPDPKERDREIERVKCKLDAILKEREEGN